MLVLGGSGPGKLYLFKLGHKCEPGGMPVGWDFHLKFTVCCVHCSFQPRCWLNLFTGDVIGKIRQHCMSVLVCSGDPWGIKIYCAIVVCRLGWCYSGKVVLFRELDNTARVNGIHW